MRAITAPDDARELGSPLCRGAHAGILQDAASHVVEPHAGRFLRVVHDRRRAEDAALAKADEAVDDLVHVSVQKLDAHVPGEKIHETNVTPKAVDPLPSAARVGERLMV